VRLFIAVDVPEEIKDAIERDVVGVLGPALPGARWSRPEGRHLTLKFLGEVAEERMGMVSRALSGAVRNHASFRAAFDDLGGFPNVRRPRVLWLGIGEGAEPMATLARDIEAAFEPLGFVPEDRPFRAHLTVARFPKPRVVEDVPPVSVPDDPFDVSEVVLFRSQLHPKGARYTALERFALTP
jgi:2'-5' RNA ligase